MRRKFPILIFIYFTPQENSSNIVASRSHYACAANEHRSFGNDISAQLQGILNAIDSVVEENLRMERTSAQINLVVQKLRTLIPELKGHLDEAASITQQQENAMLSIAGGGDEGLEQNRAIADSCRTEQETCMRLQAHDMRDYADQARTQAIQFETDANALRPQLSATKPQSTSKPDGSVQVTNVPDHNVRNRARTEINRLETDAQNYRTQAENLDTAAGYLEDDIRYAGSLFDTYCAECVACDNHFAGEFARLAGEVRALTGRIQAVRDSFCPTVGITDWGAMAVAAACETAQNLRTFIVNTSQMMVRRDQTQSANFEQIGG